MPFFFFFFQISILHSITRNKIWSYLGFDETLSKKYEYNTSVGTHEVAQNHVKIVMRMDLFWLPHELKEYTRSRQVALDSTPRFAQLSFPEPLLPDSGGSADTFQSCGPRLNILLRL